MCVPDLQRRAGYTQKLQLINDLLESQLNVNFVNKAIRARLAGLRPQSEFLDIEVTVVYNRVYVLYAQPHSPRVTRTGCLERHKAIMPNINKNALFGANAYAP